MTMSTLYVFDGLVEELISNDTREEFESFSHDRKIQHVLDYAENGCNINLTRKEGEFISNKIIQYFKDLDDGKTWRGDSYVYHEYEKKLEDYEERD